MKPWLLHPGWGYQDELGAERAAIEDAFAGASGHLLSEIPAGSIVIPRYRALPFGRELQSEVEHNGSQLVNTYDQHRFAADIGQWYPILRRHTPQSWPGAELVEPGHNGPFVVKGETNSRRQLWHTHCFAATRDDLGPVIANLTADTLIGHQRIWIREFIELNVLGKDISGMPLGEEYRVFYLDGREVARGFYWANSFEHFPEFTPRPDQLDSALVATVGQLIAPHIRFAAVDFARTARNEWIVIEVNDGSQAGICGVDPNQLWANVAAALSA